MSGFQYSLEIEWNALMHLKLSLYYNLYHHFSAMKNMFISKDLYMSGKRPFDERWLKSVGVSADFPHTASLVVDSSMGTGSLFSDLVKTLIS